MRGKGSRNGGRGLFTKTQLWNCWVTGRGKAQPSSLPPTSTSSSHREAPLHDRRPAPGPAATKDLLNTTPPRDGCWQSGVTLLLHSHPVVLLLTSVTRAPYKPTQVAINLRRPCSQMTHIWHHIPILINITLQTDCTLPQVPSICQG